MGAAADGPPQSTFIFANSSTASDAPPPPPVDPPPGSPHICKHWLRRKACLYHDRGLCRFEHPEEYEPPPPTGKAARRRGEGGRLCKANGNRAAKFRAFVSRMLSGAGVRGAHVLDVAGGRGELAFQLANLTGAASVHVVDPRPLRLGAYRRHLARGFYHKSAALHPDIVTALGAAEVPVGHLRVLFQPELWGGVADGAAAAAAFAANLIAAAAWPRHDVAHAAARAQRVGVGGGDHPADSEEMREEEEEEEEEAAAEASAAAHTLADGDGEPPTLERAAHIVQEATLIVGMHPDQAVDAIVDAALHLGVPFFVVPCCVYAQDFPHRRGPGGGPVTTHAELLDYLQAKAPDIRRAHLPFAGQNVCLYRLPSSPSPAHAAPGAPS